MRQTSATQSPGRRRGKKSSRRGRWPRAPLFATAVCICAAVGATPASAATFSNSSAIAIAISGAATPYPSNITVSGLGSSIMDVNATLSGFNHSLPADVDVLLVSPTGQNVMLMSDVPRDRGPLFACEANVTGLNLTFDDSAGPIPPGSPLVAGTYQPTNNEIAVTGCGDPSDALSAPAPAGPYGSALAPLNSGNPNGVWSLYVFDDSLADSGSVANGWNLEIKPSNTFTLGAITRNKKKGTATVTVTVPNSGELTGSVNGAKVASARAVTSKSVGAGQAQLLVNAKGKKKRKLNETGKVKLKIAITYTPTGGDPNSQSVKVTLKKKL